ncbi:LysM domain-containing protein, partial [uncultured Sphingomonas sp.]|uniref:LysM peptidoglycan-binding domain-containing protein n=1 Tax=uncultured Sphingomonas sp. TaxID=158754 RepID=UPI002604377C
MRKLAMMLGATMLAGCIPSLDEGAPTTPPSPPIARDDDRPALPTQGDVPPAATDAVSTLPAPRPSWETRAVTPDAREIPASTYIVQPGDSLRRVADRTGSGSEAIARANDLAPPFVIRVGQRLAIPAGRYHLVRSGETGIAIARAYGVEWSRIVDANALEEPYVLRAGQRVIIPGPASGERTPSLADRAAAFSLAVDDILT